jgi:hypothetical protein
VVVPAAKGHDASVLRRSRGRGPRDPCKSVELAGSDRVSRQGILGHHRAVKALLRYLTPCAVVGDVHQPYASAPDSRRKTAVSTDEHHHARNSLTADSRRTYITSVIQNKTSV